LRFSIKIIGFADLSLPLIITGSGDALTNYLDAGGATNAPLRLSAKPMTSGASPGHLPISLRSLATSETM
jgi:hypothetical protein